MPAYHRRTVLVGDIKTHFLEAGEGPVLVLLHGGEYGAAAEITWRHNIEYLAKHFYVIAPDMLGWGGTDKIYSFSDPAGHRIRHIKKLLELLHHLMDTGNTIVVVEHNLDVIKNADFVIDLGPGGGANGGAVVAKGTPEEVASVSRSSTGRYLKTVLEIVEKVPQGTEIIL